MKTQYTVALAMLTGAALGAASVSGLYAQAKPFGAYAIVTFTEIADRAAFKENVIDKALPAIAKHGGTPLVRTYDITVLREGTPPFPIKRYVILGFDSVEKAKAWYGSDDMKSANAWTEQHTKGRAFVVEASP
jgi:uncharacterized protein (DUF1330 family)